MVQAARARMWNAGSAEKPRGDQLVVRGEERRGSVEDAHSLRLELAHDPEAFFDPVDVRRDVEPVQRDVAGTEVEQRIAWREQMRVGARPATACESDIGIRDMVGDDGEVHAVSL